jgi:hypothetical protein
MCLYDFDITNVDLNHIVSKHRRKKFLILPLAIVSKMPKKCEIKSITTFAVDKIICWSDHNGDIIFGFRLSE